MTLKSTISTQMVAGKRTTYKRSAYPVTIGLWLSNRLTERKLKCHLRPRAGCGESRTSGSAVGVWGNTPVVRPEGAPCAYYNKSTLLRHVAYAIATGNAEAVGETALDRLPIFVRIVQYSQARAADPTLTLDRYVRAGAEQPKWAPLFQQALDAGQALLLLDGLDEVIDAHQRKGIAEAIHTLAADYAGNHFLVTSRIVGYQAARLTGDFAHYTVQPLPPESISEFVEKWYAAIEREAGETELGEEMRERAEELSEAIQARPGIHRLAENPLLLTIIALVNWRGRKLPNRRVELYAHAAETLIESWPYQRQGVVLEAERVIRLLSPVAYRIFAARSAGDIAEGELLPVLADAICRVDGVDEREADAYAKEFLSQVSEHSGIFRERGYDERGRRVFGFLHLTFAEYFTARHLAGLWEGLGDDAKARRAFLRKYAHVPRWREVVLLLAGDVGQRDNDRAERATRLLGDILQLGSDYEEQLHRDLLLAGECLADDLRVQPKAVQHMLVRLSERMAEPARGSVIPNVFRAICETAYSQSLTEILIARVEDSDNLMKWGVVWALAEIKSPRAMNEMLIFLNDEENVWHRARASWALGEIGDIQAVGSLLLRLEGEKEWRVRANIAWALGKLGDTRAIRALRPMLSDEDMWVRIRAAMALRKLGDTLAMHTMLAMTESDSPEVMDDLLPQLKNEDWQIRWKATQALGEFGADQAVEQLLGQLGDEIMWVRWSAAWALGRSGDSRAVEPLLAVCRRSHTDHDGN